jgi:hypothetical protein
MQPPCPRDLGTHTRAVLFIVDLGFAPEDN